MIGRILVGVAGTPILPAKIMHTIDLAQRHGAAISLLSVVDKDRLAHVGPVPMGAGAFAQNLRDKRIERSHKLDELGIEKFEAAAQDAKLPITVIRQEGRPLDVLQKHWRYHDLCILGARGWFDYGVLPEPHDALLRLVANGVRPVLTVAEEQRPVTRALIAYDGSPESAKVMKRFAQMKLWPDLEVHIACVGDPGGEHGETLLADACAYLKLYGIEAQAVRLEGEPAAALLDHARAIDADLIAAGASYKHILLVQRFGRVTLGLIKGATIPLFLSH